MLRTLEKNLLDLLVEESRACEPRARELSQMIPILQNSMLTDIDINVTLQAADGRQYMVIYNRDRELTISRTEKEDRQQQVSLRLRSLVAEILTQIKFSLKASGTMYLIDGILYLLSWKEEAHRLGMTKEIYPHIARRYDVSPVSVERNIRQAIETAWSKMPYDYAIKHYPFSYTSRLGRPTNQEFLFAVVRMIRKNYAEYLNEEEIACQKPDFMSK